MSFLNLFKSKTKPTTKLVNVGQAVIVVRMYNGDIMMTKVRGRVSCMLGHGLTFHRIIQAKEIFDDLARSANRTGLMSLELWHLDKYINTKEIKEINMKNYGDFFVEVST